jgi:hypothetical protein
MESLGTQPILSGAAVLSFLGLVLNLIGTAMTGGGVLWFYLSFYIVTSVALLCSVIYDKTKEYKQLLLILVTISLAYLPGDIASGVSLASLGSAVSSSISSSFGDFGNSVTSVYSKYSTGGGIRSAGGIITIICYFVTLVPLTTSLNDLAVFKSTVAPGKPVEEENATVTVVEVPI